MLLGSAPDVPKFILSKCSKKDRHDDRRQESSSNPTKHMNGPKRPHAWFHSVKWFIIGIVTAMAIVIGAFASYTSSNSAAANNNVPQDVAAPVAVNTAVVVEPTTDLAGPTASQTRESQPSDAAPLSAHEILLKRLKVWHDLMAGDSNIKYLDTVGVSGTTNTWVMFFDFYANKLPGGLDGQPLLAEWGGNMAVARGLFASDNDPLMPKKDADGTLHLTSIGGPDPMLGYGDVGSTSGPVRFWKTDSISLSDGTYPGVRVIKMEFYGFSDGWNTITYTMCPANANRC